MKWSLACAGALVLAGCLSVACFGKSDEGEPGPGGTSTSSSGTPGASSTSSGTADSGTTDGGTSSGAVTKSPNGTVGCDDGSTCESGVCFLGNNQHFCTVNCTAENATEKCKAPLTGTCNKQGLCKRD